MTQGSLVARKPGAAASVEQTRGRGAVRRRTFLLFLCLLLMVLLPSDGYLGPDQQTLLINQAIGAHGFRLGAWEWQAWAQKVGDAAARPGDNLTETQRHELVLAYFAAIGQMDNLNAQVAEAFARRTPAEAAGGAVPAAAEPLQAELESLRAEQAKRRPAVERILQEQVAEVLREAGLTTAGMVWPPVIFQFTESPDVLIISPRDHIALQESAFVDPAISVGVMEQIEGQAEKRPNVSAVVDGTGGFSAYPTMVLEYDDLGWVLSTVAHEWSHTYLAFHPLGWHYFDNSDTRTLNETSASIIGDEIGNLTLHKYYPDQVPPPSPPPARPAAGDGGGPAPRPEFDYAKTMHDTRLHVDALLAQGKVTEAEAYMEAQREVIVQHGYALRKLNQAYFAFHGSYAVGPGATDPIGEKLRSLRERSRSLVDFVHRVESISTVAQLDALLAGK